MRYFQVVSHFIVVSLIALASFALLSCQDANASFSSAKELSSASYDTISVQKESAEGFAAESLQTFQEFRGDLSKTLTSTIRDQGPAAAIQVCSVASPEMESRHSGDARIYRISDRPRNPDHTPNDFEMAVLNMWKSRMKEGQDIGPVQFRTSEEEYVMNPIPIQVGLCLQCHGVAEQIKPEVKDRIAELYPEDEATGYSMGDLRGAFVAKRALSQKENSE